MEPTDTSDDSPSRYGPYEPCPYPSTVVNRGALPEGFSSGGAGVGASLPDPGPPADAQRGGEGACPRPEMAGVMEAAQLPQLPVDEASLDEVHPDAWRHKITPDAFYDEVKADSQARGRIEAVLTRMFRSARTRGQNGL